MSKNSRGEQFAAIYRECSRYGFTICGENPRGIKRLSSPRIREMCGFRVANTVYLTF